MISSLLLGFAVSAFSGWAADSELFQEGPQVQQEPSTSDPLIVTPANSSAESLPVYGNAASPCLVDRHDADNGNGRIDRTHDALSRSVCWPSKWFDRFFANPDDVADEPVGTLLRVIYGARFQEDGETGNEARVRASVDMPNMERRLSLVLRNNDDIDGDLSSSSSNRPGNVGENEDNTFRAALRWALQERERHNVDIELGLRSELKTFVRGRYRWRTPIYNSQWLFRFTESIYWKDLIGFGTETRLEFDRPLGSRTLLRLTSEGERSEELVELGLGWDLDQSVTLYHRLNQRSAIQFTVGAQGFTDPTAQVEEWRTSIRFRRNIWRPWLYYEVEPFVVWPRLENYKDTAGIVLRLETQFGLYSATPE
ncbi:MAG: hypothetical protein CVV10_07580 [Gammaproteobacteria bacterium HGW-Gammaproteobacteria-14]|nr:MAG: hypothetical protein CVV10_07580 [Gammaproteobacteria bacterium HGW-Gammaproteobacteria-14]